MHQRNFPISFIAFNSDIAKKCIYKDDIEMNAEGLFYQDIVSILIEVDKKYLKKVKKVKNFFCLVYTGGSDG